MYKIYKIIKKIIFIFNFFVKKNIKGILNQINKFVIKNKFSIKNKIFRNSFKLITFLF
jgi:hypothetical protein